jgi:transcriptional regulator with XRE-family HTH domain
MLQTFEREKALKAFGGNVRRERTYHRMTQEKLAKLAQLNVRTIAKIEAGELNIRSETIDRIQQAIRCALSRLIDSNANRSQRAYERTTKPISQITGCLPRE